MKTKLETGQKSMNTRTKLSADTDEETAKNYPRILDNISDGVYALNTDGYFTYVNKVIEERSGIPAERFYHLHFFDILNPEYHDLANNNFQRVMRGEDGIPYELAYTNIYGELQNIEIHSRPIREEGKVVGLLGMARNIAERKRAEDALKKSEEKYRAILENSSDAIILADKKGNVLEANNRAEGLFGYKRKELLQMNYTELHPASEKKRTIEAFKKILKQGAGVLYDGAILRKDGRVVYVDITASVIEYDGTKVIQGSFRDMSDKMHAKEILEQTVRKRTIELFQKNTQLINEIRERKRAETALRKKSKDLHLHSKKLEELNAALKVLLRQREEDKTELEEKVLANVKLLLSPHLETLKKKKLDPESGTLLDILDSNLKDIISPFSRKLSSKYLNLTPTEIRVANLIREGISTKDIARLMKVSANAVNHHRHHIREKLGILSQKVNLSSYLSTLP